MQSVNVIALPFRRPQDGSRLWLPSNQCLSTKPQVNIQHKKHHTCESASNKTIPTASYDHQACTHTALFGLLVLCMLSKHQPTAAGRINQAASQGVGQLMIKCTELLMEAYCCPRRCLATQAANQKLRYAAVLLVQDSFLPTTQRRASKPPSLAKTHNCARSAQHTLGNPHDRQQPGCCAAPNTDPSTHHQSSQGPWQFVQNTSSTLCQV